MELSSKIFKFTKRDKETTAYAKATDGQEKKEETEYVAFLKDGTYIRFFIKENQLCFFADKKEQKYKDENTKNEYFKRQEQEGRLINDQQEIFTLLHKIQNEIGLISGKINTEIKDIIIPQDKNEEQPKVNTAKKNKEKDLFN